MCSHAAMQSEPRVLPSLSLPFIVSSFSTSRCAFFSCSSSLLWLQHIMRHAAMRQATRQRATASSSFRQLFWLHCSLVSCRAIGSSQRAFPKRPYEPYQEAHVPCLTARKQENLRRRTCTQKKRAMRPLSPVNGWEEAFWAHVAPRTRAEPERVEPKAAWLHAPQLAQSGCVT